MIAEINRKETIEKAYQRGDLLSLENEAYRARVEEFLKTKLGYDIGKGDVTTDLIIKNDQNVRAVIKTEEKGVVTGIDEICIYYESNGIAVEKCVEDGAEVESGQDLIYVEGNARKILSLERLGLNVLRTMSGIATVTKEYTDLLDKYGVRIAATRKFRLEELMDKRAVHLGGGLTHRLGLDDFPIIKDCHLGALVMEGVDNPTEVAIRRIYESGYRGTLEIEVEDKERAVKAAETIHKLKPAECIAMIMLDNMTPKQVKGALELLRVKGLYDGIILEASGGINLQTVVDYAKTGVDVISTSDITEGTHRLNIKQEVV